MTTIQLKGFASQHLPWLYSVFDRYGTYLRQDASPLTEDEFMQFMERWRHPNGLLYIIESENGEFAGYIGFDGFDYRNRSAYAHVFLEEQYRGQGIATDALKQAMTVLFLEKNFCKVKALIPSMFLRTQKLAQRVGARHVGTLRKEVFINGKYHDVEVYELLRGTFIREQRSAESGSSSSSS